MLSQDPLHKRKPSPTDDNDDGDDDDDDDTEAAEGASPPQTASSTTSLMKQSSTANSANSALSVVVAASKELDLGPLQVRAGKVERGITMRPNRLSRMDARRRRRRRFAPVLRNPWP